MHTVTPVDILHARRRLAGLVWTTPCVRSAWLSEAIGCEVYLKLENLQHTGSFKLRGALNKLKLLASAPEPPRVLTVSAGNHGRAVAYGASLFGLTAMVIVPRSAPPTKIEAIRQMGVELCLVGESYDEAEQIARRMASHRKVTFISPHNDPDVIAGQGTVALELLDQVPNLDTILMPVAGGGLLAGMAVIAKALNPIIKVIGVQAQNSPAMYESFRVGRLVAVEGKPTLADGLAGNVEAGSITFPLICKFVDDILLVSEESLRRAIVGLLAHEQLVVEAAGGATVAALLTHTFTPRSKKIAAILSGRNIDLSVLHLCLDHA